MRTFKAFMLCILLTSQYMKCDAYILPIFQHWHSIEFVKNIDRSKPYAYNIGELPLVSWFDKDGKPQTTVNICSHMGSTLDKGRVNKDGCLVCPYHGLEHNENRTFGKSVIFQDKLWWSYEPKKLHPPAMPFYNNKKYETSFYSYVIDGGLVDCTYNLMDVNHPAFVHNNPLGFGSTVPATNFKIIKYPRNDEKIGISFSYKTNRNLHRLNGELRRSKNFHIFEYPYTTWSRVTLPNKEQLFLNVNFLPISENKTKMLITIRHNFWKTSVEKAMIDFMTYCVFSQDREQMQLQAPENDLKKMIMHQHKMGNEEHLLMMKQMFAKHKIPDLQSVMELYSYHKIMSRM
jgi:phenylpropionate dioxygenase-like ring-hydroxylating dioxygenase large terminal subunit